MSRMGSGGKNRVSWLWRAPGRALGRARDLYVRGLTSCAGQFPGDAAFGYPSFPGTPRSCSRSGDDFRSCSASPSSSSRSFAGDSDLRELMRAASERRAPPPEPPVVPRSQSVAMGKIDEDRPCDFGGLAGADVAFGRSRSYAVSRFGQRGRAATMQAA
ncbi:uncharacterized protein [Lolium perenne]|uniref:uncharacterized protein n=1 Tax=Lolium perenne TaxID=4522 RepID=UPI0021EA2114|nr:uncharacterized protein LOC127334012 [Lolium perenne]